MKAKIKLLWLLLFLVSTMFVAGNQANFNKYFKLWVVFWLAILFMPNLLKHLNWLPNFRFSKKITIENKYNNKIAFQIGIQGERYFLKDVASNLSLWSKRFGVKLNSIDDIKSVSSIAKYAPYDFALKDRYYVEVKVTTKPKPYFVITETEYRHLELNQKNYFLVHYYNFDKKPIVKVFRAKDIIKLNVLPYGKYNKRWYK